MLTARAGRDIASETCATHDAGDGTSDGTLTGLEEITEIAAGSRHSCAVRSGGSVTCRGAHLLLSPQASGKL